METTNNELDKNVKAFLDNMSEYIQCKLYFYGSVQRSDYFPSYSDIDIDVFSETPISTLHKLKTYLKLDKSDIRKIVTFIDYTFISGYKVTYLNERLNLRFEVSIFPMQHKDTVLQEHLKKTNLPIYALFLLIILKTLYYKLQLLNLQSYRHVKAVMLSYLIGFKETPYVALKNYEATLRL
jgi:predicted nucleotidyltransferase